MSRKDRRQLKELWFWDTPVPVLVTIALAVGFGILPAAAGRTASMRSYEIPNRGSLELVVPQSWRDAVRQPPEGLPPTITFSAPTGDDFVVLITPLWHATAEPEFNAPQKIRTFVERRGQKLLSSATEDTLTLEELRGPEAVGYFYSLTDRTPKPGEYKYMTQGAVGLGEFLLTFTILYRNKHAPEHKAALEMLKTARQKAKKTS